METEKLMNELSTFLQSKSVDLRYAACQQVLGLLADDSGLKVVGESFSCWVQLVNLACEDDQVFIKKCALQCLINLCTEDIYTEKLSSHEDGRLLKVCLKSIVDRTPTAESWTMLLSNMTRTSEAAKLVWDLIKDGNQNEASVERFVELVCDTRHKNTEIWDHLAQVLCNLSQLTSVRRELTREEKQHLKRLITAVSSSKSILRSKGLFGLLRNCCFDIESHSVLLSDDLELITALVYPLAGPEELDEDENDKLPLELQYLEPDKKRESDPEIRKMLLEALLQLCATKQGRMTLKQKGIYYLMRELHKWEETKSVLVACENLVDILIGDEPKSEMENLKEIDIPSHLQEKFKKMDEEDNS